VASADLITGQTEVIGGGFLPYHNARSAKVPDRHSTRESLEIPPRIGSCGAPAAGARADNTTDSDNSRQIREKTGGFLSQRFKELAPVSG
jgi:hypothetical protein